MSAILSTLHDVQHGIYTHKQNRFYGVACGCTFTLLEKHQTELEILFFIRYVCMLLLI